MSAMQTIRRAGDATGESLAPRPSPKLNTQRSPLSISPADRECLTRWTRAATSPRRVVTRSLIVLLATAGASNVSIATQLGVTRATVALWKARFAGGGPDALLADAPGRGRKPGRDPQLVARILHARTQHPPRGARWTVREIARRTGASRATVQRVLREHAAASRPASPLAASPSAASSSPAQPISETPFAPAPHVVVATALPKSSASTPAHVIRMRPRSRREDDGDARRFIQREVTA